MPRTPLLACLLAGLALVVAPAAAAPPIRGTARVHDGDTLQIGRIKVRLHGIDAPELDQTCGGADGVDWPCGVVARDRLAELAAGGDIACTARDRDAYGRIVAACEADGVDVNATLVEEGLAWAYLRFSAAYAGLEADARAGHRGVWQGNAIAAWDYRVGGWQAAAGGAASTAPAADDAAHEACPIKGNITAEGERVYHTPASRWYTRTRIDEAAGEAWFCDAAAAEAAGWRAAR